MEKIKKFNARYEIGHSVIYCMCHVAVVRATKCACCGRHLYLQC